MTDTRAVTDSMERIGQSMMGAIKRALVIPQEPSQLPPVDDPLYEMLRGQHQTIARLRGRPCGCGSCTE